MPTPVRLAEALPVRLTGPDSSMTGAESRSDAFTLSGGSYTVNWQVNPRSRGYSNREIAEHLAMTMRTSEDAHDKPVQPRGA